MGGSYAFSVIGNSGKTCGDGDTETCRMTTAIKYRENIGAFRLVAMLQPVGLFTGGTAGYSAYNPNNGAIEGGIGGDVKNLGPGVLSVDVLGAFEKDAVNWGTTFPGQVTSSWLADHVPEWRHPRPRQRPEGDDFQQYVRHGDGQI